MQHTQQALPSPPHSAAKLQDGGRPPRPRCVLPHLRVAALVGRNVERGGGHLACNVVLNYLRPKRAAWQ